MLVSTLKEEPRSRGPADLAETWALDNARPRKMASEPHHHHHHHAAEAPPPTPMPPPPPAPTLSPTLSPTPTPAPPAHAFRFGFDTAGTSPTDRSTPAAFSATSTGGAVESSQVSGMRDRGLRRRRGPPPPPPPTVTAVPTLPTNSTTSAGVTAPAGPLGVPVALATPVLSAAEVVTALPVRGPSLPTRFNDRTWLGSDSATERAQTSPRVSSSAQPLPTASPPNWHHTTASLHRHATAPPRHHAVTPPPHRAITPSRHRPTVERPDLVGGPHDPSAGHVLFPGGLAGGTGPSGSSGLGLLPLFATLLVGPPPPSTAGPNGPNSLNAGNSPNSANSSVGDDLRVLFEPLLSVVSRFVHHARPFASSLNPLLSSPLPLSLPRRPGTATARSVSVLSRAPPTHAASAYQGCYWPIGRIIFWGTSLARIPRS